MEKLTFLVCANFLPEFAKAVESLGFDDIDIKAFPSLCQNKRDKDKALKLIKECTGKDNSEDKKEHNQEANNVFIFCSRQCDIEKLAGDNKACRIIDADYCFNHLANEAFINYIINKGGYIIASGWLNNWRQHIEDAGFTRETARDFYGGFARELVFFDAGTDKKAEDKLKELSDYLKISYLIIPFEIKQLTILIRSLVYQWRANKCEAGFKQSINEVQSQCAEYSAILDLIGKISTEINKRDTIVKIEEIFRMILGGRKFKYWDNNQGRQYLPKGVRQLFADFQKQYILEEAKNLFYISIQHNGRVHGVIEVGDFLFPNYIERYLNFSLEIAKVCGLVLTNIFHYEKLIKSEHQLKYLSFHDSLTGLYNYNYIKEIAQNTSGLEYKTVFMLDMDNLKYTNDNFGHNKGDEIICGLADILKSSFREGDIVARIGGDEFVALLLENDLSSAETIKDRLQEAVINYNAKTDLKISVSIGYAVAGDKESNWEDLLHEADKLMYAEKSAKKKLKPFG